MNRKKPLSDDTIHPLRNHVASQAKAYQPHSDPDEPCQVALVLLARYPNVHAPETRDDVHGENDGTQNGELAEDVGGKLLALVHTDVDLSEVVAMGACKYSVWC